jgi:hypothetical protein
LPRVALSGRRGSISLPASKEELDLIYRQVPLKFI